MAILAKEFSMSMCMTMMRLSRCRIMRLGA